MDDEGNWEVYKTSSTPADPSIGFMKGLQEMADNHGVDLNGFIQQIELIVHGTTVTTNAVLTRKGARTALLTTQGLRDVLQMRRGVREELYNNRYTAPSPVIPRNLRLEVEERANAEGEVVKPLNEEKLRETLIQLKEQSIEAIAICFMHSYRNSDNEEKVARIVKEELPEVYLTLSSKLLSQIGIYDRVSTTSLNSYVGPILERYLRQLTKRLLDAGFQGTLLIMQSNGGVTSPEIAIEKAATTLLSGPAAGPVAGIFYTAVHGLDDCITVDMGGTSFDVALVRNRVPLITDKGEINRLKQALPSLEINTVGAGGGSIGWIDQAGLLRMGPASAGAVPGPACYGRGGEEPTCTDANLLLGYLNQGYFLGGKMPLNYDNAYKAVEERIAKTLGLDVIEAAAGMYRIININMASAIREISVERGIDPREYPLVVAGGAGPIHAGMIALELEIPVIIVPRHSSIFCASGMLMSDLKHDYVQSYPAFLKDVEEELILKILADLIAKGKATLLGEGLKESQCKFYCSADLRYVGQHHEINVEIPANTANLKENLVKIFHTLHDQMYGYNLEGTPTLVEMISLRVAAVGETIKPDFSKMQLLNVSGENIQRGERSIYLLQSKGFQSVPVYDGDKLPMGIRLQGPALVEQVNTTILVPPEYDLTCEQYGSFILYLRERLPHLAFVRSILEKNKP